MSLDNSTETGDPDLKISEIAGDILESMRNASDLTAVKCLLLDIVGLATSPYNKLSGIKSVFYPGESLARLQDSFFSAWWTQEYFQKLLNCLSGEKDCYELIHKAIQRLN